MEAEESANSEFLFLLYFKDLKKLVYFKSWETESQVSQE